MSTSAGSESFPTKTEMMYPKGSFAGELVLINGADEGVGRTIAVGLAQLGAKVALTGLMVSGGLVEQIKKQSGSEEVYGLPSEPYNPDKVEQIIDSAIEAFSGDLPTILVNNAAPNFVHLAEKVEYGQASAIIDILLKSNIYVTLGVGNRLIANNKGARVLSLSGTYAETGSAYASIDAAAKSGLEAFSKSMAVEWAPKGFRFNVMQLGLLPSKTMLDQFDDFNQARLLESNPMGRYAVPEEITNLALYLLSPYSNWINGSVFRVDGGAHLSSGVFSRLAEDAFDRPEESKN